MLPIELPLVLSAAHCDVKMAPPLKLNAIAFISPQNYPILIRTTAKDELKYHYIAHTSLDVIEERGESCAVFRCRSRRTGGFVANSGNKSTDCYLGLLYAMEDVAVYGYMTPLKVKIVLALALSDNVVRDAEVCMVRYRSDVASVPQKVRTSFHRYLEHYTWLTIRQYPTPF